MLINHAKALGYAGLIPFIGLPFAIALDGVSYFEGMQIFNQYSVIILAFLSAVWWFDGLQNERKVLQLYLAMVPSVVGILALALFDGSWILAVTLVGFIAMLWYEWHKLLLPDWYKQLRLNLTLLVCAGHGLMFWLVFQY